MAGSTWPSRISRLSLDSLRLGPIFVSHKPQSGGIERSGEAVAPRFCHSTIEANMMAGP